MPDAQLFFDGRPVGVVDNLRVLTHKEHQEQHARPTPFSRAGVVSLQKADIDPVVMANLVGLGIKVECKVCEAECTQVADSLDGMSAVYECKACGTQERVTAKQVYDALAKAGATDV